ncbi:iron complex transport system permease protein [Desulfatibacillum alkenivorans DSM 16219]|jgi:iron complex transport system permease protein|uniref:Iron complex transport system permease protein n=1 Tax=Desulfatibacillum alkenivorans DSM 16219 TaxID=1121393 RepID=A0A1M6BLX8_9BACT|nr:iron ABC transporter permease [Desulfatibacillum alkenivorans]SHI49548.1 iron complex transport system permease protein [Desulfatibacillum alkenivorans DSM 16219]
MHLNHGEKHEEYSRYVGRKAALLAFSGIVLVLISLVSISKGAASLPIGEVAKALLGFDAAKRTELIVWNIRLPQVLAAIVAGAGLSLSGAVMQSVLRNPLGSPFTLGISHAAAFGAAFAVMIMGSGTMASSHVGAVTISNPYVTTGMAFLFSMGASGVIVGISRMRGASPEIMVLSGVALGALFTAGTMFLQFFADDVQLAAMVFWTFGDVGRASWSELGVLSVITLAASAYFLLNAWNYNAVDAGDETAQGLGVRVQRVRIWGMIIASLVTAVAVAFLGIIGFVGLVCPHMVRRLIGGDNRYLLPASMLLGAILLLASDTVARLILAPHLLPVSILTAFMGAPVFLALIIKGYAK